MLVAGTLAVVLGATNVLQPLSEADKARALAWIAAMKSNRRGPFAGVSWFCNDGTVLPPKMYACVDHGGGVQYGVLSRDAQKLGEMGIYVGTVLTGTPYDQWVADDHYRLRAHIVEAYLERALDGWTLQSAKSYRGFRQVEDEQESARRQLLEMAKFQEMIGPKRSLLVRAMRSMPYGKTGSLADEVRALAGTIGDADDAFADLRFKIHAMPEPTDIPAVEAYAKTKEGELADKANELATKMKEYYDPAGRIARLKDVRQWTHDGATKAVIDEFVAIDPKDTLAMVAGGAKLIETADKAIRAGATSRTGERNLLLLHIMAIVEELWIGVTAPLIKMDLTRRQGLDVLAALLRSAEALGWITQRELDTAGAHLKEAAGGDPAIYAAAIREAGRSLEWARARLSADVGIPMARYAEVEPRAVGVIDDVLRSSVILPLAAVLDRLESDLERLRGGGHRLVGLDGAPAVNVRGQNPGIASGPLRILQPGEDPSVLKRDEIALLHGLPPELPPVAGILTIGQAGSLSHVALLARNLGIPHASINSAVAMELGKHPGRSTLVGVSVGKRVVIGWLDAFSVEEGSLFKHREKAAITFSIDEKRLDLKTTRIHMLDEVAPEQSGVLVGPKAAELGRLRKLFPDRVSNAAVIPFGAFVRHVDRPAADGGSSPLTRLRQAYARADRMTNEGAESYMLGELEKFRTAIATAPFAEGFEGEVDAALNKIGRRDTFGVFIRSDTNVEDLKQFTGAGLNKTVANKVKRDAIMKAIRKVWASPFTERSYRWRQRLLKNPAHVYPSVILHKTVPCDTSGVMVTTDLERLDREGLTVSISEGVAAVVDGGAPETVVLEPSGRAKLIQSCRAITRKVIPRAPREGVELRKAEGKEQLLGKKELAELNALANEVKARVPQGDEKLPWDIEFGFYQGKAYLMQLRPLRTDKTAATHPFLRALDAGAKLPTQTLSMNEALK